MNYKLTLDDILKNQDLYLNDTDFCFKDRYFYQKNNNSCLEEKDFYPPSDDRVLESYVEDIEGGDNFADYCKEIFKLYEEEEYYED